MSERIFRINLSGVKALRVVCQNCRTAVEVPLEAISEQFANGACRFCCQSFESADRRRVLPRSDMLWNLARALREMNGVKDQVRVEIVLPADKE